MKLLPVILFVTLFSAELSAQTTVCGLVTDGEVNEPLAGATVIIKDTESKIRNFTSSDTEGKFSILIPTVKGWKLEISRMGFKKQMMSLDSISFPLTVAMTPETVRLKEVVVKADRIREQGDTISYTVGSFAQAQDLSIGDVLKRMPGIDVAQNGQISYQGENINQFYIENSDLLGGKYGLATNGINHEDVGTIEVMENHQPMQVLTGISFSDKAAINLKLKNKAKATWSFHGNAGSGWSWNPEETVWDGELFAMAMMPGYQNITTVRTNNTGESLASSNTDFFADHRNTNLSRHVNIELPDVPSLNDKRTLFNRSFLVSTNNLWKLKRGEFKANIDYSFDRTNSTASNITTYFLNEGNRSITENRDGTDYRNSLSGKFTYELNQRTTFVNNTLRTNADWNETSLRTTGSLPNKQSALQHDYFVGNNFKLIKRFKDKHLVTFQSINEWESLAQTLHLYTTSNNLRQQISDHAFYTQESAAYSFVIKDITLSLEGGVKGYLHSMDSQLPEIPHNRTNQTEHITNTHYFTVYTTPKLEYWVKKVNLTLNMPVSYTCYSFGKTLPNRNEAYLSPSLSLNWKPGNRFSGTLRGSIGRSPMDLNLIHSGLIITNYHTLKAGINDFYNSTSQQVSASFQYKHTRHGLFANAMAIHSWNHSPYTLARQLYDNYAVYTYANTPNNSKILIAMGNVGKTLDFIHGSCNINSAFNRSESLFLSQSHPVSSISTSWSIGGKINGSLCHWFSLDYSINYTDNQLSINDSHESWLSTLNNEFNLTFIPHHKWKLTVGGEYYRNELTEHHYKNILMLDSQITLQLNKRIKIAAYLTNILNTCSYNYITYSELSSFESQRQLRGRQLLLSIILRT